LAGEREAVQIKVCHLTGVCGECRQLCEMLKVADNLVFELALLNLPRALMLADLRCHDDRCSCAI
jgi:hypothetical protein